MTVTINNGFKSNIALSFKDSMSVHSFYMYIGKTTPWDNESVPDTLDDTVENSKLILDDVFAIKKITSTNVCLVVPRYSWASGTIYTEYDPADPNLFTKNFYVADASMNVYKCLSNNSGSASTVPPTGQSTSQIQTSDGYIWKFLYNISSSLQSNFLTNDYLPVPSGDQRLPQQILVEESASYTTDSPLGGHGSNACIELGSHILMISQSFVDDEGGIIDNTSEYREIGILKNPRLISTGEIATGSVYSVGDSNSNISQNDGEILYVDTKTAVNRNNDQTENIKLILSF